MTFWLIVKLLYHCTTRNLWELIRRTSLRKTGKMTAIVLGGRTNEKKDEDNLKEDCRKRMGQRRLHELE